MQDIKPGGGDTGRPLNVQKRLARMQAHDELRGRRILDCGCGAGHYVLAFLAAGGDALGIEYEADKVADFRQAHPDKAARVMVGDVQHIAFESESFDVALANEVLEHVPDDARGLREIYRILKPGGRLFVFSPNRLYPFETHGVYMGDSERKLPIATPFVPYIPVPVGERFLRYWARNYWPRELQVLIAAQGFTIAHTDFVWQTFENISGKQPRLLGRVKPLLRRAATVGERVPGLRAVGGVSQFIVAVKPEDRVSA